MWRFTIDRRFCALLLVLTFVTGMLAYMLLREIVPRMRYPLLSPRIFVSHQNDILINFTNLRTELRGFVTGQKDMRIGVYFEYLPTGVSIGVNEKQEFISASLLKVPFVMGVFKLLEHKAVKGSDILVLQQEDLDSNFGELWKRGAGTQISVDDAIRLGLTQSDNTAIRVLDSFVSQDLVQDVYNALDIPVVMDKESVVVSPKNYSSVFRCLYLSCFLKHESSEEILNLLTHSIFIEDIPAGVPESIPVAHKVGMYEFPDSDKEVRSDCGIVYVPKRPYILCIIVENQKGQETKATEFMRTVSSIIYRFVASAT